MNFALIVMLCVNYLGNPNNPLNGSPFLTKLKKYVIYKDYQMNMIPAFRKILTGTNKLMNKKEKCP